MSGDITRSYTASRRGFNHRSFYDFQSSLVDWALRLGRAAIFADCGLGKTPIQLVWAQNIVEQTNRPVLIIAPLAVSSQTIREAQKFGSEQAPLFAEALVADSGEDVVEVEKTRTLQRNTWKSKK